MATLQKRARSHDSGWTTNSDKIIHNDGSTATTATNNDTLTMSLHDFSALPSSCDIDGITVDLNGYKDETGGSGTMQLRIDLSWDGGTTWTSKKATSNITTSAADYSLGGATDTWGRSWTRTEITDTTKFRCRLTATGSIVDFPDWHCDYVFVTVHYTDTTALTLSVDEQTPVTDAVTLPVLSLSIDETLPVSDGGAGVATGANPPAVGLSGTAITELFTSGGTNWQNATLQRTSKAGLAAQIIAAGASPKIFYVGDANTAVAMDGFAKDYQPGLLEFGDITFNGSFGSPSSISEAVIRIRNSTFVNIIGSARENMLEAIADVPFLGGVVNVQSLVFDPGSNWNSRLMFSGVIEDVSAKEEYVEIRAYQGGDEEIQIPTLSVDEDLFVYGDDEGGFPEEWAGTVLPIGYGRFDSTAVKNWNSGHPLAQQDNFDPGAAFMAPYVGLKVPMMPVVLGSDLWLQKDGGASSDAPKIALYMHGDTRAPAIQVATHYSSGINLRYYGALSFDLTNSTTESMMRYLCIFTWDSNLDRALPFRTDLSGYGSWQERGGAGDIRLLTSDFTDGLGRYGYACYINRTSPADGTTDLDEWTGATQSVALFPDKLTPYVSQTAYGSNNSRWFGIINNTGDPLDALNGDMLTRANIVWNANYSVQMPASGPNLGDMVALSVGWLTHKTDSDSDTLEVSGRFSHNHGIDMAPGWEASDPGASESYIEFDATDNTHGTALILKRTNMQTQLQPNHEAVPFSSVAPGTFGFISPWNFTHTDVGIRSPNVYGPHAVDVAFYHNQNTSDNVYLYSVFYDVAFRSQMSRLVKRVPTGPGTVPLVEPIYRTINPTWAYPSGRKLDGDHHWDETFEAGFNGTEPASIGSTPVFITGRGPEDSGGTYTGSGADLIENPCDIVGHLLAHYVSSTVFNGRATGSNFGSFVTARDVLNNIVTGGDWIHSMVIDRKVTLRQVFSRIASQSRTFFQRQVDPNTTGLQWRAFVDLADPATDDSARLWRTDGGLFTWDDIAQRSFEVRLTDRSFIANRFTLKHGFHIPSGKWSNTKYVNESDSNFDNDGSAYQTSCNTSQTDYSVTREVTFEAPDIWRPEVAEELLKYYCDIRRDRRVIVEFDTFTQGLDLLPGHVIKFDDEIGDRVKWPGRTGDGDWSDYQFNVTDVTIVSDPGEPMRVHVVAIETITEAA